MNGLQRTLNYKKPTVTRADEIYEQIRLEILALNLKPGELLQEEDIAARYNASRTPVREAFRKLEQDGLITVRPRRGAYISEISIREVLEIDELRELIEPVATRKAAVNIDPNLLVEFMHELDSMEIIAPKNDDYVRYLKFDVKFHEAILLASGNATMHDVVTRLHHRINAIRIISTAPRYRESIDEHKRIILALQAGDGETACLEMRDHIRNAMKGRVRAFTREG